jgi:hydrogenase maturation protease
MDSSAPPVVMIGVGNSWRGDDAVGLLIARELRRRVRTGFTVLEHEGDGAALMDLWGGTEAVILADAAASDGRPGTIHRREASGDNVAYLALDRSTHLFGLGEAIELARTLGRLPRQVVIYAVEARNFDTGGAVSVEVKRAIPAVVEMIEAELERMAGCSTVVRPLTRSSESTGPGRSAAPVANVDGSRSTSSGRKDAAHRAKIRL